MYMYSPKIYLVQWPHSCHIKQDKIGRLESYDFQTRKQNKSEVSNVLDSWSGNMSSRAIITQLCSIWRKNETLKKSDKNMCCKIFRKSASTGSSEATDPRPAWQN